MNAIKIPAVVIAVLFCMAADAEPKLSATDSARIVREAERIAKAPPGEWAFMIVDDKSSGRFVQFYADDGKILADVLALSAAIPQATGPARDTQCSEKKIEPKSNEVEQRVISIDEERRIFAMHGYEDRWSKKYCLRFSVDEQRVGYLMTLTGFVGEPAAVPAFVESFFRDIYRLEAIGVIEIETDQNSG